MQKVFYLFILLSPLLLNGQTSNYWSRNFNEESSLLSGAVVGGGAGASAIFYNPASISEIKESKLSLNASLFSYELLNAQNAWGENIDFHDSRGYVIPRFFSYMFKPKTNPNWSFEVAVLNNANFLTENTVYVDKEIDILNHNPGTERYTAFGKYSSKLRDDWFGIGGSFVLNEKLSMGGSMFVSAKSQDYSYMNDIEAGSSPSVDNITDKTAYFSAKYSELEYLKFNDYRVLWKFGLLYKEELLSIGINITSPSIGNIYSDGKRLFRKRSQVNISDPETGAPLPNYLISDYKEKKGVQVNSKSPLSIALGLTYHNQTKTKTFYFTVEYFSKISPYKMVEAVESDNLTTGTIYEDTENDDWLTYMNGANQVFNAAIGYRWIINKKLMILSGFRTDFNNIRNLGLTPSEENKMVKSFELDKYHVTTGLTIQIKGHEFITGIQYTFGMDRDQKQFVNLSDPVEFSYTEMKALQGTRENSMNSFLNTLSLYFGATINFGE